MVAIFKERAPHLDLNEARLRMARIPAGADLVENKVSTAPGFMIGNVIVMAGVPSIMQAMLDAVSPQLRTGQKMLSETVLANAREGDIGTPLGEIAKAYPDAMIGSYPFFDGQGPNTNIVVRSREPETLAAVKAAVEEMLAKLKRRADAGNNGAGNEWQKVRTERRAARNFPVSWDEFHRDARALAWRLAAAGPFESIVAVTRGGLVPAAIVARELGIRLIETVCVASYNHQSQGEIKILKSVAEEVIEKSGGEGKGVLIVDDLVDTGKTARVVRDLMPKAHFATVYAKPMGRPAGRHLHHRSVAGHLDLLSLGYRARIPAADPRQRLSRRNDWPPQIAGAIPWRRFAGVAKLVDARDLKSLGPKGLCRFKSGRPHRSFVVS